MPCMPQSTGAALLCMRSAGAALAVKAHVNLTDQRYTAGKFTRVTSLQDWANCPRDMRDKYRGDHYCGTPSYQMIAQQRHSSCPADVTDLSQGALYCSGRG
ncbi:MAG: hypothetical protein ABJ360_06520 [Roseobacter sp.]